MDGIQAAVLEIKLRHLDENNQKRVSHAQRYDRALAAVGDVAIPRRAADVDHVYHIYAIRVRDREEVMSFLRNEGIGCGIHYPIPLHLQKAYRDLGLSLGAFPVAEECAREFISLPMFPELTPEQIDAVARALRDALDAKLVA